MGAEHESAERLPIFPTAFLWATLVITGWGLLCSVVFIPVLVFGPVRELLSSDSQNPLDYLLMVGVMALLFLQTAFLFVWMRSSIRLLRLKRSGVRAFRACLITVNVYLLVVALGQLAAAAMVKEMEFPFLVHVVVVSTVLAVVVLLLSFRMFQHLASPEVQTAFDHAAPNLGVPGDRDPRERGSRPLNTDRYNPKNHT